MVVVWDEPTVVAFPHVHLISLIETNQVYLKGLSHFSALWFLILFASLTSSSFCATIRKASGSVSYVHTHLEGGSCGNCICVNGRGVCVCVCDIYTPMGCPWCGSITA